MMFCLDDGAELLYGPASGRSEPPASAGGQFDDEPQTAILSEPGAVATGSSDSDEPQTAFLSGREAPAGGQFGGESATRPQINTTDQTATLPRYSSAMPSEGMRRRLGTPIIVGAILLVIGGIGFAAYKFWPKADRPAKAMSIERLTTNGKSRDAAISPDGKYVVYILDEGGQQSLWTRQIATTSNVQIVPPSDVRYTGLVFTPDSNYINFVKRENADLPQALFQLPVLGGNQKQVISNISGGVGYSPDGKQMAFVRQGFPATGESSLLIANADGTQERLVTTRKSPQFFASVGGQIPAWSPDGKSIASIAASLTVPGLEVVEVQIADGSVKDMGVQGWHFLRRIAWLPDKSGFLILGTDKTSGRYNQQISRISYPDGKVSRVTNDSQNYTAMSVSVDSGALVAIQFNVLSNIWIAPNGDAANANQIRSGGHNLDGVGSLAWTPDGRIVYSSLASGAQDLWIMNGDGSGQKQLTAESGSNFEAAVSPDGRYIVYTSGREEGHNIWRMDIDGGNPMQLTRGNNDDDAAVTADSKWVIYDSRSSGEWNVWKVSIDGGDPVKLTDYSSREVRISPDGKLIACEYREDVNSPWRYAIFPFEGGKPIQVFDMAGKDHFGWSKDSRSMLYNDTLGGVGNIFSFPLDGGSPKQLTKFKTEQIYNFAWSADGKTLVLARGTTTSDAVLIRNFR
jgi:eukaryotic-like serine/threonine-protein kinase